MDKNRKRALITLILVCLYVISRLSYLTKIPIFTDEAIYIRWGQIALQDPAHRFISLEDGKQPLFIWLMIPALKFISDPLVAGRIVSVAAGFISLAATVAVGWILFGETIGWLTGVAYIVSPFFLLYDRLALYDSLTAALMSISLLLSILLAKKPRLDLSLLLGAAIGLGLLTKSSAQFAIFLLPVSLLLMNKWHKDTSFALEQQAKLTNLRVRLLPSEASPSDSERLTANEQISSTSLPRWLALAVLSVSISLVISLLLRLSPLAYMVKLKQQTFIVPLDKFLADPFSRVIGNLSGLNHWLADYLTWPWIVAAAAGIAISFKKFWRQTLFLLSWFIVPYLALAAFGIVLYPRFLLFMAIPLLALVAKGLTIIKDVKVINIILPVIIFSYPASISYRLIFNPLAAPIPQADRGQLLDDWPAGYGIVEVVEILKIESQAHKIFIGTEGTFGLTPYALNIYLKDNPNVEIKGYWPIGNGMPEIVEVAKTGKPTFVLFKDTQIPNPQWPLSLVEKYRKGRSNIFMSLYRVTPQ
jgi:hypothetical protein